MNYFSYKSISAQYFEQAERCLQEAVVIPKEYEEEFCKYIQAFCGGGDYGSPLRARADVPPLEDSNVALVILRFHPRLYLGEEIRAFSISNGVPLDHYLSFFEGIDVWSYRFIGENNQPVVLANYIHTYLLHMGNPPQHRFTHYIVENIKKAKEDKWDSSAIEKGKKFKLWSILLGESSVEEHDKRMQNPDNIIYLNS